MNIGKRVRELRRQRGYTQSLLAEISHVSQSFISKLEKGQHVDVSTTVCQRLANALDTTVEDLCGPGASDSITLYGEATLQELLDMYFENRFDEMHNVVRAAYKAEYFSNPTNRAKLELWDAVILARHKYDFEAALQIVRRITRSAHVDHLTMVWARIVKAQALVQLKQYDDALVQYNAALKLVRSDNTVTSSKYVLQSILFGMGTVKTYMGNIDEASAHLRKASELIDKNITYNVRQRANILFTLASIEYMSKRYDNAIEYAKDSLRHYRFVEDVPHQIELLNNLGHLYREFDDIDESNRYYGAAIKLATQHPNAITPSAREHLREAGYDI